MWPGQAQKLGCGTQLFGQDSNSLMPQHALNQARLFGQVFGSSASGDALVWAQWLEQVAVPLALESIFSHAWLSSKVGGSNTFVVVLDRDQWLEQLSIFSVSGPILGQVGISLTPGPTLDGTQ